MKKVKGLFALLLAAAMTVTTPGAAFGQGTDDASSDSVTTAAASESPWVSDWQEGDAYSIKDDAYQIYPVPQSVVYPEGQEFTLENEVNIVAGADIDQSTKDYLNEVLEGYGRTGTSAESAEGAGNIVIGIKGSGDQADQWFAEKGLPEDLFQHPDAYAFYAEAGNIYILGKDADAAFYGVATLKMMFSSFAGTKFFPVQIQDYASIEARGYIEGFYGGWTHEQRKSLMEFSSDIKMNIYIYASKSDPYHTSQWDVLYPESTINEFKELIALQEKTKCEFSWSVHLGTALSGITSTSDPKYTSQLYKMKEKFDQLYDIGVRRFCVLNDDFGGGDYNIVVSFVNELDNYLKAKGCEDMIYCPQGYNDLWETWYPGEVEAMQSFNENIHIFWTGSDVNSPFYQDSIDNAANLTGHSPVFWVNYPVSEHAKSGVFLGSIAHYIRDSITGLAGAVSNPIFFAEADKVALFQLGAYFWNVNNYSSHTEEVWEQCFKYLQPEVYDAYLTIARNVSDCPGSSRIPAGFEESLYIKDALESVLGKIEAGEDISTDQTAADLLAEFRHIQSAVDEFMEKCENEALVQELSNPGRTDGGEGWLQALKNATLAGELLLSAEMEMDKASPDLTVIWENFASASAEMSKYNERTYQYPDGNNRPKVKAASKRVVPFVESCLEDVSRYMEDLLADANEEVADRVYTNMEEYAATPLTIQEKEYSVRNVGRIQFEPGDYIGIKKSDIADISALSLEGTGVDSLTLQYSMYGDEWTDAKPGELDSNAAVRYVRLINEGTESVAAVLSKLAVVIENLDTELTVKDTNMSLAAGSDWSAVFDGDSSTAAETVQNQNVDDYVIIDMGRTQAICDITITTSDSDLIKAAELSVSADNTNFDPIAELTQDGAEVGPTTRVYSADAGGAEARFIKLTLTEAAETPLTLCEIAVNKNAAEAGDYVDPSLITTNTSGNVSYLNDKDLSTVFLSGEAKEGDYLEYKVANSVNVEKFRILQSGSCDASVLAVKADGSEQDLGTLSETDQTFELGDVGNIHAIRLEFAAGKSAQISEVIVTYGADPSEDVGQAVDNIYLDSSVQDSTDTVNLALDQSVEVSGVETSAVKPESAVDGTLDTKWDSGPLKGNNASSPQWIIVDLGGYSNMISSVSMSYFNKVYPTDYDIQVSDDKESWITVKTIQHENDGPTYPVDTVEEEFEVPVMARYVRLLFRSINSVAAGNCIGLRELEVNGVRRHAEMSYVSVQEMEDLEVQVGAETALTSFVEAVITAESDQQNTAVKVIPEWSPASVDTSAAGAVDVFGSLPYRYNLSNPLGCEAAFTVTVKEGVGTEPGEEDINLATGSTIEVSDVEWELDGSAETNFTGDLTIDGNSETRWSSGPLNSKSFGEPADQWLILDLGGHDAYFSQIRIDYYRKVWPTNYQIQVSNDKETWIEIKAFERASSDAADITDTIDLEVPVMARYIRLFYPVGGLNENAAGGSVSIKELAVTGKRAAEGTVYSAVEEQLEKLQVENTVAAEELELQQLIDVRLDNAGKSMTVQVIPTWELAGWNELENVETTIYGTLPAGQYVQNPDNVRAEQVVVKGTPETEEPEPEPEPEPEVDKTALSAKIHEAQALTESDYTPGTWAALQSSLAEAVRVNGAGDVDQQTVDQALTELQQAIDALEKVVEPEPGVDKTALDAKIQEIYALTASDYTPETWAVLQNVLAEAVRISGAGDADQATVNRILAELNSAVAMLAQAQAPGAENPSTQPGANAPSSAGSNQAGNINKAVETGDSFAGGMYVLLLAAAGAVAAFAVTVKSNGRMRKNRKGV